MKNQEHCHCQQMISNAQQEAERKLTSDNDDNSVILRFCTTSKPFSTLGGPAFFSTLSTTPLNISNSWRLDFDQFLKWKNQLVWSTNLYEHENNTIYSNTSKAKCYMTCRSEWIIIMQNYGNLTNSDGNSTPYSNSMSYFLNSSNIWSSSSYYNEHTVLWELHAI